MAISVRACMPGQRIFTSRTGVLVSFFYFDLTEGSQGTIEAGCGHWGQTRFGHARSERRRPQFTAHNSVRPFENGLRSLGSSATRPGRCREEVEEVANMLVLQAALRCAAGQLGTPGTLQCEILHS